MKYLCMLALLVSCAGGPTQLSEKAREVEVLANKPSGCVTVGKVVGRDKTGSREVALNEALNLAAKLGASSLHINQEVPNGSNMTVHATGYKCD